MEKKFSAHWRASSRAGKQKKFRHNAPLHIKRKIMSSNLSEELRKKFKKRSFPVRKGDTVKIMRGEFKNQKGKISEINRYKLKVYVEGIQKQKKDGTKYSIPLDTSNIQITEFAEDKKRQILEEKK